MVARTFVITLNQALIFVKPVDKNIFIPSQQLPGLFREAACSLHEN